MFYVKTKINDETTIRTELTDENVFTICPGCGKEQLIDNLAKVFEDGGDLFCTAVYCTECSAEIRNNAKK